MTLDEATYGRRMNSSAAPARANAIKASIGNERVGTVGGGTPGPRVCVAVGGTEVEVDVGVAVAVGVDVDVAVAVGVAVEVGVGVRVGVGVGVEVGVAVGGGAASYVATSATQSLAALSVPCAAYAPVRETTQYVPNRDEGLPLPTPPSDVLVEVPVAAQGFDVPLVPAEKPAIETSSATSVMAPKISSFACVVVAVAPLDGAALRPAADAVLSSGVLASPVTEKAWTRSLNTDAPPVQVTVIVEPDASCDAMACVEQMVVSVGSMLTVPTSDRVTSVL